MPNKYLDGNLNPTKEGIDALREALEQGVDFSEFANMSIDQIAEKFKAEFLE
jgi:hypothetical protein